MSRLQVIYRAHQLHQAHLLKNLLETYGIRSHIVDTDVASLRENIERTPEVVVAEKDVEVARGIAEIFHQHLTQDAIDELAILDPEFQLTSVGLDEETVGEVDAETPWTAWPGWPTCMQCGERRQTACPICQNAGNLFSLAYVPVGFETEDLVDSLTSAGFVRPHDEPTEAAALKTNVLLLCNICDEPFLPRFYQQCEHCGHQFSDGIAIPHREESPKISAALLFGFTLLFAYGLAVLYLFTN